ncbi:permease [uncultured Ruegeria sp.]|uniref:permease n=1 Tax=uncultured Ruegeria sp. TaxID=259304 RepID=UPI0026294479|nr:permease [uncultured Ruegeria sp.]
MAEKPTGSARRNVPVLASQGILSQVAWTLGSPSIVLPFLAVSLELPMFLAGALVSIRMTGSMISDIFLAHPIAAQTRKKRGIALTELGLGGCLLMALAIASTGSVTLTAIAFVVAFFLIGLIEESQSLMLSDLFGDQLKSKSRMIIRYLQLGAGGLGAIGLVLLIHEVTKEDPPFSRHSAVIAASVVFFLFSALCILGMAEARTDPASEEKSQHAGRRSVRSIVSGITDMFAEHWFRRYLVMRLPLVVVSLSVPFFALIAAEAHHASAKGLTAMIVSSASGYLVSAPLWQAVNLKSHRAVMVAGNLMVATTGIVLLAFHYAHIDHEVHLHAIALFVVSVATTGISSARKLYFLDVAPKEQRIQGAAAIKSICRLTAVALSAMLAAVAHMHEVALAIVFIVLVSIWATFACYRIVQPPNVGKSQA